MALLSLIEEDIPFAGLDAHFNADLGEILLHGLGDRDMARAFIGQICDADRSLIGKHTVFKLVAGALKEGNRFIISFVLEFFREISFPNRICIAVGVLLEDISVAVCHAGRDEGSRNLLLCLSYILDDVVAVDQDRKRFSHIGSLFHGLTLEKVTVDVESHIVCAEVVHDMEIFIVLDGSDFVGRNRIGKIKVAGIVCGIDCRIIGTQHHVDLGDIHCVGIEPVVILLENKRFFMGPAVNGISAVRDVAGFGSPCARICAVRISRLDCCLRNRVECRECSQIKDVSTRCIQVGDKCLVVRSSHIDIAVGVDRKRIGEQIAVIRTCLGPGGSLPRIFEIGSREIGSV